MNVPRLIDRDTEPPVDGGANTHATELSAGADWLVSLRGRWDDRGAPEVSRNYSTSGI